MKTLRIATRQSPLALWQARHVAQLLTEHHPGLRVSLVEMTTEGDRFLQSRLSERGGKGLFVKEIETAVLEGRAELAVHSLKDMTSSLPKELCIAAVPPREDPRDAWVSPSGMRLGELPEGSQVVKLQRECEAQLEESRKAAEAAKQMQEAAKQKAEPAKDAAPVKDAPSTKDAAPAKDGPSAKAPAK